MQYHDCRYYNYDFSINGGITFNIGKAADNEWVTGTYGNRIYRKAGGIDGWISPMYCNSANKMRDLMNKYMPDTTKDEVIITVYDYTHKLCNYDQIGIDKFLLNEEHNLIKNHEMTFGTTPVLNIQPTKSHYDCIESFNNFFEEPQK